MVERRVHASSIGRVGSCQVSITLRSLSRIYATTSHGGLANVKNNRFNVSVRRKEIESFLNSLTNLFFGFCKTTNTNNQVARCSNCVPSPW